MAQIQTSNTAEKKRGRQYKPAALKVDMTHMVDLGFLLITFFIITTTMAQQKAADLFMPKEGLPSFLKDSRSLTLLLDSNDQVHVYAGSWEKALANNRILQTSFLDKENLRNLIKSKQVALGDDRKDLMVLIKPAAQSQYQTIIDALDEMLMNDVKKYALVDLTKKELAYLDRSFK